MANPKCPTCNTVNLAGTAVCRRCGGNLTAEDDPFAKRSSAATVAAARPGPRPGHNKSSPRMGFVIFGGLSLFFGLTVAVFPSWFLTTPDRGRAVSLLLTLIVSVFVQLYGPWPVAGVLVGLGALLLWIGFRFRVPVRAEPE